MTRTRHLRLAIGFILIVAHPASPTRSEQTRVATSTATDLERGEAQGVAVTSRGRLFLAPRVSPYGQSFQGAFPAQVFAAAADDEGNIFLGTGPDGQVVRLTRSGDEDVLFRADEPLVTSVLPLQNGDLLAATAPGGRIYKVRPDGKGGVWCETQERYVWALVAGPDGSVFAATGDRGRLLKLDRNGNSRVLFDGDETHLVSLAVAKDGGLWAGGAGRGLVYRIDAEGHGLVVYDDELPEAKSIVVTRSGNLIVALDAPPISEKRLPALRLRVAGGSAGAGESMSDLDARQAPALQGVIEGLPSSSEDETVPLRGKIVRITPEFGVVELWRSRSEAAFAVALDESDRTIFATGEPAKLWRVEGPDEIALLATLNEAQATAFAPTARTIVVATSNPVATYRLESALAESGTFLAAPADAGSVARWGTLSWQSEGKGGRVELFTRTGNCEDPDGTWSAWSPAQIEARGSPVTSPEGRFYQWRARLTSTSGDGPRIASVTASYATCNRAPSIRDVRIEPATYAVSAKATLRWSSADPDGDDVTVTLQARPAGTSTWKIAVVADPPPSKPSDPSLGNDGSSKDGKAVWDTAAWEEGVYDLRAVASDQPSNPENEGLEAESALTLPVRVDRTPPTIDAKRKDDVFEVVVKDALSAVAQLAVVSNGRVLFSPLCEDGVCDNTIERFRIRAPHSAPSDAWTLRATDAAGNAAEIPVPAP
jgi:sugar lactone lactonase YvrE